MFDKFPFAVFCLAFTCVPVSVWAQAPKTIASDSVTLIVEDGQVYASGDAAPCRGDDQEGTRNHFKLIAGLNNISEVVIDETGNAAALDRDGFVWVWGNDWHEGVEQTESKPHVPFQHPMLKNVTAIAMGTEHLVALEKSGSVVTVAARGEYFNNTFGELGNGHVGVTEEDPAVSRLVGITDGVAVAAGEYVTLVLRADGTVWGCGIKMMLGQPTLLADLAFLDPAKGAVATPIKIAGLEGIKAISVRGNYAVALDANGQVWGWGLNESGQLGPDSSNLLTIGPRKLLGLRKVVAVSAGYDFLLALTKSGEVIAQGSNVYGTLGDDGGALKGKQRTIAGVNSITQISAGVYSAFARTDSGKLLGWGSNDGYTGGFAAAKDPLPIGVTEFDVKTEAPKPSPVVAEGGVKAIVFMEHDDYFFKSENVQVVIGESKLSFAVDDTKPEARQVIEMPAGMTSYTGQGTVVADGGRRHEITLTGNIVVSDSSFEKYLETLAEQKGLALAIKEVEAKFLAEGFQAPLVLQTFDPWSEKEFEEFEAKSKVRLPEGYKEMALEMGFFSLGFENSPHPLVSLLPPDLDRNLEQYTAKALAAKSDTLPDGPFKIVCRQLQNPKVELPQDRLGWKNHLILATAGGYFHLLVGQGDGGAPVSTWTEMLEDYFEDEDAESNFNWKQRGEQEFDFKEYLMTGVFEELYKIFEAQGVVPLNPPPMNQPVYINITWPGFERPKEGEVLEYLLQSDDG